MSSLGLEQPIEVAVSGLMVDPLTQTPIVILKSLTGDRILPIWIGPSEAQAIALKRENVALPRPMTHDLVVNLILKLGASITGADITDLHDGTFYARLELLTPSGHTVTIDCRPSDAIALALRVEVPIRVAAKVFAEGAAIAAAAVLEGDERLRKWFESVDPSDFSKYSM